MTRRATAHAVLAATLAATFLSGCSPEEQPTESPTPTTAEPTETEETPAGPEEIAAEEGFAAVEDYNRTYYLIANGRYEDEGLISQWLDSLGPNWRETMRRTIETAQAQDWSISGTPDLTFREIAEYEETENYHQFWIVVCEDRTPTVPYVADVEQEPDFAEIVRYKVYSPVEGEDVSVDGREGTGESCE